MNGKQIQDQTTLRGDECVSIVLGCGIPYTSCLLEL